MSRNGASLLVLSPICLPSNMWAAELPWGFAAGTPAAHATPPQPERRAGGRPRLPKAVRNTGESVPAIRAGADIRMLGTGFLRHDAAGQTPGAAARVAMVTP